MSAIPSEARLDGEIEHDQTRQPALPIRAQIYWVAVVVLATAVSVPFIVRLTHDTRHWEMFVFLAAAAAAAHVMKAETARNTGIHWSWVFLIAGALLLPPEFVALMGVVMNIPDWLKYRYPWYIQGFNIANYTLTYMIGWAVGAG